MANTLIEENSNVSNFHKDWWGGKSKKQKWVLIIGGVFVISLIGKLFSPNIDPCKCSELGANAQMIGYDNLSDDSKKKLMIVRVNTQLLLMHVKIV